MSSRHQPEEGADSPEPRPAVAVIGTNLVIDYGTEERARAAMEALILESKRADTTD